MRTFVVRIHSDGADGEPLRGVVDDVSTGARSTFHAEHELVAILVAGARCPRMAEVPPPRQDPAGS